MEFPPRVPVTGAQLCVCVCVCVQPPRGGRAGSASFPLNVAIFALCSFFPGGVRDLSRHLLRQSGARGRLRLFEICSSIYLPTLLHGQPARYFIRWPVESNDKS